MKNLDAFVVLAAATATVVIFYVDSVYVDPAPSSAEETVDIVVPAPDPNLVLPPLPEPIARWWLEGYNCDIDHEGYWGNTNTVDGSIEVWFPHQGFYDCFQDAILTGGIFGVTTEGKYIDNLAFEFGPVYDPGQWPGLNHNDGFWEDVRVLHVYIK